MSTVKEEFEFCDKSGTHTITSQNILCCADTGRVVAVFYNEHDLIAATGLTKKVILTDGECYQFQDHKSRDPIKGTYDGNGACMWQKGKPHLVKDLINIQPLGLNSQ